MIHPSQFARFSAAFGGLIWIATLSVRTGDAAETDLIQKIFLLAVFVIVPLALSLISKSEDWLAIRFVMWVQLPGAILCFISLFLPPGILAGALASVWLAITALIALAGLQRVLFSSPRLSIELSISAGMLYLPIGGAWFVASRLGLQPLGFGDTIVLLTAVHFHFAGFAAPVLAGFAGRVVVSRRAPSRAVARAAVAIVLGTPVVAAGITLSPKLALAGAFIVTIGLASLAISVMVWVVPVVQSRISQLLLVISSLSSFAAMVLASLYAYSIVTHTVIIDIPHMALTHGLLNSLGFALCGLLAWTLNPDPALSQ